MRNAVCALILSVLYGASAQDTPLCPQGWSTSGAQCFWYSRDLHKNWAGAQKYCQSIGGQLASTYNKTGLDFIKGLPADSVYATWVGLYDRGGSYWAWIDSTFTSYLAEQWILGEPQLNNGQCGALRTAEPSGYYTLACQYMQPFLCSQKVASCDRRNFTEKTGQLSSPGFPAYYSNNENCVQHIVAPSGYFISFTFDFWSVEKGYDYVLLYDGYGPVGAALIANISSDPTDTVANVTKNDFQTTTNIMTVQFVTDSLVTYKGWVGNYTASLYLPPVHQSGQRGTMNSNHFPDDYDDDTEQLFYVTTLQGTQVHVEFSAFATEYRRDYLCLFDGPDTDSPLIGNFSGTIPWILDKLPGPFTTTGNALTLFFYTDYSITYDGWNMTWRAV